MLFEFGRRLVLREGHDSEGNADEADSGGCSRMTPAIPSFPSGPLRNTIQGWTLARVTTREDESENIRAHPLNPRFLYLSSRS